MAAANRSLPQWLLWSARHPTRALRGVGRKAVFPALLRLKRGMEVGVGADVCGMPLIDMDPEARIVLGPRVTLNSWNEGYHVNMHSRVKLMADMPGALIRIGADTRLHGSCIHACGSVVIGERCLIAANSQI